MSSKLNYTILATTYSDLAQAKLPSALKSLTSVFGMGTGVPPSLESPRYYNLVIILFVKKTKKL